MYYLWVNVTLNLISGLVFRMIMTGAYLLYYAVGIPNFVRECILGWKSVPSHFWVTVTLTSYLVARICLESSAYHSYF